MTTLLFDERHSRDMTLRNSNDVTPCLDLERAASTIQRIYRGYRTRRELRGLDLAASRRELTPPRESHSQDLSGGSKAHFADGSSNPARQNWNRAVSVAIQASGDDAESETARATSAKHMDLEYFLEMVDSKHRHGSNLRAYHALWKKSPSSQNFFYWLDHGEGRDVEVPHVPRERLERQQIRYLTANERFNYLVNIGQDGLFRWAKTGELVETNDVRFRDSLHGIVPIEDNAPRFTGYSTLDEKPSGPESASSPLSSSPSSSSSSSSQGLAVNKTNKEPISATEEDYELKKATKKFPNVNPAAIYDRFAGSLSVKKGMWIFVADTSFRIYVGIKEPGAFQHSSFLRGGRIAAAGLLKIKAGQLRKLAPLSGHYRPHLANFRAFHHSLLERGVDLSRVSMSYSYAVLAGIEGYTMTKRKMRSMHEKIENTKEKIHLGHPHAADAGS
ncbi:hypothetical protein N7523_003386 [Penicillium sp. IBT 18751x]|nr:hypothetical protein N7523_003386 [Penicillium sp. IBT 18751x]